MPLLHEPLSIRLKASGIALKQRKEGGKSFEIDFSRCKPAEPSVDCPLLNRECGCELEREQRPFECRIWPLRVMNYGEQVKIAYYRNCPAIKNVPRETLEDFLNDGLRERIKKYLAVHPETLREARESYEAIMEL